MSEPGASSGRAPIASGPMTPELDRAQLIELHGLLSLVRGAALRIDALHREGEAAGGWDPRFGSEAVVVGAIYALEPGDVAASAFAHPGPSLLRGETARACFARYLGREMGPALGRDRDASPAGMETAIAGREERAHSGDTQGNGFQQFGALRMDPDERRAREAGAMPLLCSGPTPGDQISVLAGCALAFRMRGSDRICFGHLDGGAASTGAFHEGLSFAAARNLPVVLVIERGPDAQVRRRLYGCPVERVDGLDVVSVHRALHGAVARARAGGGPQVVEAALPARAASSAAVPAGRAGSASGSVLEGTVSDPSTGADPVARFEGLLISNGIVSREGLEALARERERKLDEDLKWARSCPVPSPRSCTENVYAPPAPLAPASPKASPLEAR